MATIHNNLPRLRLAATKTQERRKDADDSELSHNDSGVFVDFQRFVVIPMRHLSDDRLCELLPHRTDIIDFQRFVVIPMRHHLSDDRLCELHPHTR